MVRILVINITRVWREEALDTWVGKKWGGEKSMHYLFATADGINGSRRGALLGREGEREPRHRGSECRGGGAIERYPVKVEKVNRFSNRTQDLFVYIIT